MERAFEIARAGTATSVSDVKLTLKAEGYATEQISGRVLLRQLAELIKVRQTTQGSGKTRDEPGTDDPRTREPD
jgi:hypothetical protein